MFNMYISAGIEAKQMFVASDIAKLVGEDLRMTDKVAKCAMGMTENPKVNIRVFDIFREVSHKSTIVLCHGDY